MPSFAQTNGKTIKQAFEEFHRDNPRVYEHFKRFALYLLNEKRMKKISSKLIINRIRWEIYVETTGTDYRINDAFTAHYARLFLGEFPGWNGCFELRGLRAL